MKSYGIKFISKESFSDSKPLEKRDSLANVNQGNGRAPAA